MKKALFTLWFMSTMAMSSFAQAPNAFKYQAVVRDAVGAILTNQSVGMRFTILQGSASGTAVYTETHTPTSNSYGLVNMEIGTGTTVDDFSTIDWSMGPYFIETAIDVSGGTSYTVMGTSQLISVPYALHANTADNVTNDQVDDADADPSNELQIISFSNDTLYLSNGGQVFLGNYGIDLVDDADNDPTNEIETWLTLGGIPTDIADGDDINDADADPSNEIQDISLAGSNLSISSGSTIDLSVIDTDTQLTEATVDAYVANNGYITSPDDADADPVNEIQTLSLAGSDLSISGGNTVPLPVDGDWTVSGTDMYSTVSGNVGIGTTTPSEKLDVVGTATIDTINVNSQYTLPSLDGATGDMLVTDGAGNVSWKGSGVSVSQNDVSSYSFIPTNVWTQFANLSYTFTLANDADVLIAYNHSSFANGAAGFIVTRVLIDGVEYPAFRQTAKMETGVDQYPGASATSIVPLTAGAHTVVVQYRTGVDGINNPLVGDWMTRNLTIKELR